MGIEHIELEIWEKQLIVSAYKALKVAVEEHLADVAQTQANPQSKLVLVHSLDIGEYGLCYLRTTLKDVFSLAVHGDIEFRKLPINGYRWSRTKEGYEQRLAWIDAQIERLNADIEHRHKKINNGD